ncbi:MAG: NUDIX domain-containing protein [Phycisphaerales bacterium]|nr:MAG: NUDIX domain-containing protein [Phycisphaerales bacterium]
MSTPPANYIGLPYRIAVLCYLYDRDDNLLLLHRVKSPNADMYSPIGGKLELETGEGPHDCAIREIKEETGLTLAPGDVRLTGIVSECAYEGETHWLMYLFEIMRPIGHDEVHWTHFDEGKLEWIPLDRVPDLPIPDTDRQIIGPLIQEHRGGFFMVHIDCSQQPMTWTIHESIKAPIAATSNK